MRSRIAVAFTVFTFFSCSQEATVNVSQPVANPLEGTWQLIAGTIIENGDTTVTDFNQNISFIKIINGTHFAFLQHDLNNGKDSTAVFVAGGGRYTLTDSVYTEQLEYCSARDWEGHDFSFVVTIKNDTLVQSGVEKIESAGVDRINEERYVRVSR